MQKTYIKQRWRIKNIRTQEVERLNQVLDVNNVWRSVPSFDTREEAQQLLDVYCPDKHTQAMAYVIESFADSKRHIINKPSDEANRVLASQRKFSGEGLKYNTMKLHDDNKYRPGVFYTRDVWMAQTAERSKGKSVIFDKKPKKGINGIIYDTTILSIESKSFNLSYCIVDSLRRQLDKFPNRKALKDYLRARNYSVKHTNRIISQVYAK